MKKSADAQSNRMASSSGGVLQGQPTSLRHNARSIAALFLSQGSSGTRGSALVEFSLVLPMIMMTITAMFSFGMAMNNYMVLTNGVGAGARALALARGQTSPALAASDPCLYAVGIAKAAAPNIQNQITWQITWNTTDSSGNAVTNTYNATSSSSAVCAGIALNAGDTVSVKGTNPYSIIMYGWKPGSFNMLTQTSELVQ